MKRLTLKEARNARGLTQEKLAALADMEQTHISAIETGKRLGVEMSTIKKLSEALGMNGMLSVAGLLFEDHEEAKA